MAREVGAPITLHDNGTGLLMPLATMLGPDVTYIHCCNLNAEEWKLIADSGAALSLATPIEMEMGHGVPPIQQARDYKIPWSLSNDVETEVPSDFFTQMRTNFFLHGRFWIGLAGIWIRWRQALVTLDIVPQWERRRFREHG